MNAAIRAVVRTAVYNNLKVVGIRRGYDGLLHAEIFEMNSRSVNDIVHRGGTILKTGRCAEMMAVEGQERAAQVCKVMGIDCLVVCGGDGTLRGAASLVGNGVSVMGVPCTIDMDMGCTEYSIGFDTAVNTGLEAITKIRDTSSSHERVSVIEVMGRAAGHIALWCGLTGGAEEVVIAENKVDDEAVIQQIITNRGRGKTHNLIIVAEGGGHSDELAKKINKVTGIETRSTVLGHLQRGGTPTALDTMRASIMGSNAVNLYLKGERNRVMIFEKGEYTHMAINDALTATKPYDNSIYEIMKVLAI
jgi:6-phosphofructokinase 1